MTMKKVKLDTLETKRLVRMAQVGAEIGHRLPEGAGELLAALTAAIGDLKELTANLTSAQGRVRERSLATRRVRGELKTVLEAIRRTALTISLDVPDLNIHKFQVPRGDQKLLTAARSALRDAGPMAAEFVKHAMAPDFLESLKTYIQKLEQATGEYATAQRVCQLAEAHLEAASREARTAAQRFDTVVRNTLTGESPEKGLWDKACQSGRGRLKREAPAVATGGGSATVDASPPPLAAAAAGAGAVG